MDPRLLDADARRELRSLSKDTADLVAQHLIVTGRLLDEDPQQALAHARAAVALAGRVGVVREAAGLAAYTAGEWADALSELRAARRITGSAAHLSVMADCERALGRPERALRYADDRDVPRLTNAERVELVIVVSGARRDLGQPDAAVVLLQDPARRTTAGRPWAARLWYALADALLDAGREDEARDWFERAAEADSAGETDADERLLALDGLVFEDAYDGADGDGPPAAEAWVVPGAEEVLAGFAAALTAAEAAPDATRDAPQEADPEADPEARPEAGPEADPEATPPAAEAAVPADQADEPAPWQAPFTEPPDPTATEGTTAPARGGTVPDAAFSDGEDERLF